MKDGYENVIAKNSELIVGLLPLEDEMDWICCAQCQESSMNEQQGGMRE